MVGLNNGELQQNLHIDAFQQKVENLQNNLKDDSPI